jgi:hypothetical protein
MTSETRLELQRLLSVLCDAELSDAQQDRLEELLEADAESRRLYLEYVDMHARLLLHPDLRDVRPLPSAEGSPSVSPLDPIPDENWHGPSEGPLSRSGGGRGEAPQVFRYMLVAVVTLAASLLVQFSWPPARPHGGGTAAPPASDPVQSAPPASVATLTQLADCVWEDPAWAPRVGSRIPPGRLRLRAGIARVRIDSGPDLVVEGPADLRLESGTAATVARGKVVILADETAAPFELHTPSSTLVDLGTEYAVAVGPEGEEVHVFAGEVQRTPRTTAGGVEPEHLAEGEARRYGRSPDSRGESTKFDPGRFVRQLSDPGQPPPDPMAGLLAYEGFDYRDAESFMAGEAAGGSGWTSRWTPGFARPYDRKGDRDPLPLNVNEGLFRPGASLPPVGGSVDYTGFAKYYRRLATPVRLDADGVYYLSFLFRRQGPPADRVNAVAVLLRTADELQKTRQEPRTRLNIGVGGANELFTHLQRVGSRTPLPLSYGETYLLVAKIAARRSDSDQVFMRVYGPEEPVEREEPTSWSVVGPALRSDLAFEWLELHINSRTRQTFDEFRLGTTWSSVTAPWIGN